MLSLRRLLEKFRPFGRSRCGVDKFPENAHGHFRDVRSFSGLIVGKTLIFLCFFEFPSFSLFKESLLF